jgi:predicted ester cyclase
MARHRKAFPDCQFIVDHLVAEGDIVAANTRFKGAFRWLDYGPWEPTGKAFEAREADFFRIADGKIVEMWIAWDRTSFVRQLEVVDAPSTAGE